MLINLEINDITLQTEPDSKNFASQKDEANEKQEGETISGGSHMVTSVKLHNNNQIVFNTKETEIFCAVWFN